MDAIVMERLLAWTRDLLVADSLPELAALLVRGPHLPGDDVTGALLIADPGHELRQLAFGDARRRDPEASAVFVESLVGVAPQCAALHAPWSCEYRAADHALLLPAGAGVKHLLLLPLQRQGQLLGVYCIGSRAAPGALAGMSVHWQIHVATAIVASLERLFHRARLLRFGMTDPLTGWNSRRYLHARLCEELARCRRYGVAASCLVVDADHLRRINEHLGPSAGDRVLRELGARIEALVRTSDTLAHLGGDQFAVLLPGATPVQSVPLAERIRLAMRATPVELAPGISESVTVSIGIAAAPAGDSEDRKATADQWLSEAEAALHRAKRGGGDGYQISAAVATSAPGRSAPPPPP